MGTKKYMYKDLPGDVTIWRCLDFTKFIWLVTHKVLFFCRGDILSEVEDKREGSLSKPYLEQSSKIYKLSKEKRRELNDFRECGAKQGIFINCWRMDTQESKRMWKEYIKNGKGIAIKSTLGRLEQTIDNYKEKNKEENIIIRRVKYVDHDKDPMWGEGEFNPFEYKANKFEWEKELRVMIRRFPDKYEKLNLKDLVAGIRVSVDLKILIEKIFIEPMAPQWFKKLVESVVNGYDLEKEIVQSKFSNSSIY